MPRPRNANGSDKVQVIDTRRITYPVQEMGAFGEIMAEVARVVIEAEGYGYRLTGTSHGAVEMIRAVNPQASCEVLDVLDRIAAGVKD